MTIVSLSKVLTFSGTFSGSTLSLTVTLSRTLPDTVYAWTDIQSEDGNWLGGKQLILSPGQTTITGNATNINLPVGATKLKLANMNIVPAVSDGVDVTYDPVQYINI